MKDNELQEKDLKNSPKEALQDIILPENEGMGKDTLKSKSLISQGENPPNPSQIYLLCQKLDKLPPNTKVKVKILDFESFREFLPLCNKYNTKFETFKYTTEFNVVSDLVPDSAKKQMTSFKESFTNYLKNQTIAPEIVEILQKEIE